MGSVLECHAGVCRGIQQQIPVLFSSDRVTENSINWPGNPGACRVRPGSQSRPAGNCPTCATWVSPCSSGPRLTCYILRWARLTARTGEDPALSRDTVNVIDTACSPRWMTMRTGWVLNPSSPWSSAAADAGESDRGHSDGRGNPSSLSTWQELRCSHDSVRGWRFQLDGKTGTAGTIMTSTPLPGH